MIGLQCFYLYVYTMWAYQQRMNLSAFPTASVTGLPSVVLGGGVYHRGDNPWPRSQPEISPDGVCHVLHHVTWCHNSGENSVNTFRKIPCSPHITDFLCYSSLGIDTAYMYTHNYTKFWWVRCVKVIVSNTLQPIMHVYLMQNVQIKVFLVYICIYMWRQCVCLGWADWCCLYIHLLILYSISWAVLCGVCDVVCRRPGRMKQEWSILWWEALVGSASFTLVCPSGPPVTSWWCSSSSSCVHHRSLHHHPPVLPPVPDETVWLWHVRHWDT